MTLEDRTPHIALSSRARTHRSIILFLLLFAAAYALYAEIHGALFSPRKGFAPSTRSVMVLLQHLGPFVLAAVLCFIPPVQARLIRLFDRIASPAQRTRRWMTVAIAAAATLYFAFAAWQQQRDVSVRQQDESMYLTQAHILARGRLWMPQHPQADFFETFHILARPVYAPIYFPGTALAYAPSVWLHIPPWAWAMLIAGAGVGMSYRVFAELIDGLAGMLAAMLVVASLTYRHLSTMVMSHPLMMLQALLMTWAFLHWRKLRQLRFAALAGLFAGWAAITRPVDAIAYAIPIVLAFAWELRKSPWRIWLTTASTAVACAIPLISLQLIMDYGVTGHVLETPATMYHRHYWPQVEIGFKGDLSNYQPSTDLPEFRQYYQHYILPSYNEFRQNSPINLLATARIPLLLSSVLPSLLLAALIPLCLFQVTPPVRWQMLLALPLFLAGYATFMFFRRHYSIAVIPPVLLAVFLGSLAVEKAWPAWRARWRVLITASILLLVIFSLPQFNPMIDDQISPTTILTGLNKSIRRLDRQPALIMIRHVVAKDSSWSEEPVYNTDVAWPDDARVIKAHDLGARNIGLYQYYARQNPQRRVYRFDKSKPSDKLEYLGTVGELAAMGTGERGISNQPSKHTPKSRR